MGLESKIIDYIHLPEGTILNEGYLIKERLADRSNFSIVYLAERLIDNKEVVIKEFFPRGLVLRDLDGKSIVCKGVHLKNRLLKEKRNFLREAAISSEFANSKIVKVYDCFEDYNTFYIVMKYYKGRTIEEYIQNEISVDCKFFFERIYIPLLDIVEKIHKKQYIHRDIKPSNVIIYKDAPILIDFGGLTNYLKKGERSIVLTPGFSAIELYSKSDIPGRYSDIYSLAAMLYYFFTGDIPLEAKKRKVKDSFVVDNGLLGMVPESMYRFIMRNLSLDYNKRDECIAKFKVNLNGEYSKFISCLE